MKVGVQGKRGKCIYVRACAFPNVNKLQSKIGALRGHETTLQQHLNDIEEVRRYLEKHHNATINDVAMECNMTNNHAHRLMLEVRNSEA